MWWEDVEEGAPLPSYTYELSLLRLVSFVRATGLYDYVHFDTDYARAAGARDAFIATPHVAGLFSRLATGWAGPLSNLRKLVFRMNTQSCRNDILEITGKVGRKYRGDAGEYLVDLTDLNIGHALAPHAAGAQITMELPSKSGALPAVSRSRQDAEMEKPHPEIPDFARDMMKEEKLGLMEPERPLRADEVHLWCEALEDWNPLYWDEDYASHSRYEGITAPHVSSFYGAGSSVTVGIGYGKPGIEVPQPVREGLTGQPLLQELRKKFMEAGAPFSPAGIPEAAVVDATIESFAPHRVGDSLVSRQRLLDCSPLKKTKLGSGYFLKSEKALYNKRDELVKTLTLNIFYYTP